MTGVTGSRIVIGSALLLAIVLTGFGTLIVGMAAYSDRETRQKGALKPIVRDQLFDRIAQPNPDWESWASGLSEAERTVAVDVLDEYLRRLEGDRKAQFIEASEALNIDENALRTIRTGDTHEKLSALTWLVLLESRVDVATLRQRCSGTPDLRAGAARLLYESDYDDEQMVGTEFLLQGGKALSVFGRDTLYRLNRNDPTPLLERGSIEYRDWSPSLIIQILSVIEHSFPVGDDVPLDWITHLLEHESAEIRAAALRSLRPYGWREDVLKRIDPDRHATDDSPIVREALYGTLAEWGDPETVDRLLEMLRHEPNDRVRLAAARSVYRRTDRQEHLVVCGTERAWNWVRANAAVRGNDT